jgi:hypothetical protein
MAEFDSRGTKPWAYNTTQLSYVRDIRNAYKNFNRKTEGKRPLGTPTNACEDNIRMDLREIGWGVMD